MLDHYLSNQCRQRHSIKGDGNCLFRSISFILFGTEANHTQVRSVLVKFVEMNNSYFKPYCFPSTVKSHTNKMKNNCVWGTHVEIFALSMYFNKPVFVILDKGYSNYYWAKMFLSQKPDLSFPTDCQLNTQVDINHFELCHVNNNHYDISLCTDGSLPREPPYQSSASSSLACDTVVL